MNIVDALRTGKPMRRGNNKHRGSSRTGWLGHDWVMGQLLHASQPHVWHGFLPQADMPVILELDLMANDWEIKENP